jgi:AraC-like DNA-binding protein
MSEDVVQLSPGVLERIRRLGADVGRTLELARISSTQELSTDRFFAFWHALGDTSPADIGLRLANETQVHEYDVPSLAALHSPDVRTALDKIARYKRLCGPKDLAIDVKRSEVSLSTIWRHASGPTPPRLVDASLASQLVLLQRGTGLALAPRRIELSRPPGDEAMLMRFFGSPVRFRAKRDALVLDAALLDTPFVTHNADLLRAVLPSLDAKLPRRAPKTFLDDVRATLARRMSGERPSVEKVAQELAVSPRTLQRKLAEAGVTYQTLLDEVRHDTALRLLRAHELDITEVAFLLGFEELNSFSRAFRNWEGTTPHRWRAQVA